MKRAMTGAVTALLVTALAVPAAQAAPRQMDGWVMTGQLQLVAGTGTTSITPSGYCLTAADPAQGSAVTLAQCQPGDISQVWALSTNDLNLGTAVQFGRSEENRGITLYLSSPLRTDAVTMDEVLGVLNFTQTRTSPHKRNPGSRWQIQKLNSYFLAGQPGGGVRWVPRGARDWNTVWIMSGAWAPVILT
jgi:hypothetical protein